MPILLDAGPSPFGWSSVGDFTRCERLYQLKRGRARTNAVDGPLARGPTGHIGLAHLYKRLQCADPDAYYTPEEAMRVYIEKNHIERSAWQPAVEAVVRHQPIAGRVLHVEEVFGLRVDYGATEPKRITARFDLVLERAGKVWIVDHKCVFKHDPGITGRYNISGQFLLARTIGHRTWGSRFGGVLINTLGMIPPYPCAQYTLDPVPGALATFPTMLRELLRRIDEATASGVFQPAFNETVCTSAYGPCSEQDACAWRRV